MNVYKYSEDIVSDDGYGDPQLDDTVDVYCIDDIVIIYYSHRYGDWMTINHYNIKDNSNKLKINISREDKIGFITAIFK